MLAISLDIITYALLGSHAKRPCNIIQPLMSANPNAQYKTAHLALLRPLALSAILHSSSTPYLDVHHAYPTVLNVPPLPLASHVLMDFFLLLWEITVNLVLYIASYALRKCA